ncbi:MAG: RidA family protein [Parvibaculaceae bacterium]
MKIEFFTPPGHRGGASQGAQAAKAGNLIFVGGQMSLDDKGKVVGSDIATQARNTFEALKRVLAAAGAKMSDVVKHNVYFACEDSKIAEFMADLDRVRADYFSSPGPTTTEIRVGLEKEGALILVDAWAVLGDNKRRLMPANHWSWSKPTPFSHGWQAGDLLFVGGQRSLDGNGNPVGQGDIEAQTANVFRNLETVFREAGGDRNNLMRQNTYYRFRGEGREVTEYWEKMTHVRRKYMAVPSAAGAGLRITGFPTDRELIQVEGIGVLSGDRQRLMPADHWDWSIPDNKFTQGWKAGGIVFVGGQISADAKARAVGPDLATQTRNVFNFIRKVLQEAGLEEKDVAKLYTYYDGGESWADIERSSAEVQKIKDEFYPAPGPASTAVRVTGFAYEKLLIEIEAVAICRD